MVDTVVVGGGAAGIMAARTLWDAGEDVLLVEAGDRLGGRARSATLRSPAPQLLSSVTPATVGVSSRGRATPAANEIPALAGVTDGGRTIKDNQIVVDLGCGWLHSAKRNPWTEIAERSGFTVDRSSPNWDVQWRNLGFPPDEQHAFSEAWKRWDAAAHASLDGPDRPLSDFIAPDDRWRPMIDAISGYANGAPLRSVSLHDWAAYEDASTEDNWAVREGYGTLVASHAVDVPVRLSTPVFRIDRRGLRLRIETSVGTIEAKSAIVCVPTTTLAGEEMIFDPPLPGKRDAAAALPLGLADKVFLHVDAPKWPANAHLIGDPHSACTASHRLSPFGWPIVESFFGGECAEGLENEDAAVAFAIDELVALLGSDWRRRFTPFTATRWRDAPFIGGSYSHALVGQAAARAVLAEPVDDRLFFAGEACSVHDFSTAHGAYETGVAAARAVLSSRTRVA